MSFFDLGSPVDLYPEEHPIVGVARYAEWVEATRVSVPQATGEIAVESALAAGEDETVVGKHGREVVEQAFIAAGLCDTQYLRNHAA